MHHPPRTRAQRSLHRSWNVAAVAIALLPAVSALAVPTLPTIPAGTFTVPAATGVAATDTANITSTITAAKNAGGGTVVVPAGTYLSNVFSLSSNINLHLDSGATIRNNAPTSSLITTSGTLHDISITGSGILDGRATNTTSSNNLISLQHITNVLVQGVTIQNSSHFHLVVQQDTNLTVDGININDDFTRSLHSGVPLANTDGIDYSGSHILIQNSTINSGDDDIVAKPSSVFCSDIAITNDIIGTGHGISVGGQTNSGLDGMTVSHITFNGTDNGLRLKSGAAALPNSSGGGVVKNVTFSDITMTNVTHPIIINSWYNGGDHYGSQELSGSGLHTAPFDPTNPGDPTVNVNQSNNTDFQPFFDNITYSNITATGGTENVAIIYGLNSIPANPADPLRNIDNIAFHNVNLSGKYGADIYYVSNLDVSGLSVTATNGNATNLFGNTSVPLPAVPGDYDGSGTVGPEDYDIWQANFGSTTELAADGDGDHIVDAADYTIWLDHFGQTTAGSGGFTGPHTAVPEPGTLLMLLAGMLTIGVQKRAGDRFL